MKQLFGLISGSTSTSGTQGKAPVPPHVAQKFLDALSAEYTRGQAGAVGAWYERDNICDYYQGVLDRTEDKVRGSPNPAGAIARLYQEWGVPPPRSGGGMPMGQAVPMGTPVPMGKPVSPGMRMGSPMGMPMGAPVGARPGRTHVEASRMSTYGGITVQQQGFKSNAAPPRPGGQLPMGMPVGGGKQGGFPMGIPMGMNSANCGGPRQARRRAVLIGVNYFGTSAELRGCINDVHNLQSLLTEVYGWDPRSMLTLTDDQRGDRAPTRGNIERALMWLVQDVRPGDSLFFSFSGHGAQEEDPHGFEEDGMHETILPMDFKRAGMMTDDQLNDLIVKPLPEGVRLTCVMDCCHSGTGLDLPYRHTGRGWREETNPFHTMADVQMFSGCEDEDTSSDASGRYGRPGGAMTTAICDALRECPRTTYPQLMACLHDMMVRRGFSQRPQLTSSQAFSWDRPFNLDDAIPNMNQQLGRIFRRRFPPQPRRLDDRLSGLLGIAVAVVAADMAADMAFGFADMFFD